MKFQTILLLGVASAIRLNQDQSADESAEIVQAWSQSNMSKLARQSEQDRESQVTSNGGSQEQIEGKREENGMTQDKAQDSPAGTQNTLARSRQSEQDRESQVTSNGGSQEQIEGKRAENGMTQDKAQDSPAGTQNTLARTRQQEDRQS